MSITVERRYRVTANGSEHDMSEDEARALAFGLLTALGIAPAIEPVEIAAEVVPPAQLPSGPVARDAPVLDPVQKAPASEKHGPVLRSWQEDEAELRRLHSEGLSNRDIAARLDRSAGAVSVKLAALGLRRTPVAPLPTIAGMFAAKEAAASVRLDGETQSMPPSGEPAPSASTAWVPDGGWTFAQTKALIRAMAPGHGGIREASEATGHSMGGCGLRWKHLKAAGIMTVEKYMSSPEAQA